MRLVRKHDFRSGK